MIYWISEEYVRENLPVDYSLLSGNILPSIAQSQFINARDLIGDKLYDRLNDLITTGDINDPNYADYKYLMDAYLQNVVLYWTAVYLLVNNLAKLSNRGNQSESSEFSTAADLSVYRELKREFSDYASYWSDRCNEWLLYNQNLYPEFEYWNSDGRQPASSNEKYRSGGLVLGATPSFSYNNLCFRGRTYLWNLPTALGG